MFVPAVQELVCVALAEIDPIGVVEILQAFGTIIEAFDDVINAATGLVNGPVLTTQREPAAVSSSVSVAMGEPLVEQ